MKFEIIENDAMKEIEFNYSLHKGLDENPDHNITPNDLQDIYSFSFSFPYLDLYRTKLFTRGELDSFWKTLKIYNKMWN